MKNQDKFDITKHLFTSEREGETFDRVVAGDEWVSFLDSDVSISKKDVIALAKHFKLNLQDISEYDVIGDDCCSVGAK